MALIRRSAAVTLGLVQECIERGFESPRRLVGPFGDLSPQARHNGTALFRQVLKVGRCHDVALGGIRRAHPPGATLGQDSSSLLFAAVSSIAVARDRAASEEILCRCIGVRRWRESAAWGAGDWRKEGKRHAEARRNTDPSKGMHHAVHGYSRRGGARSNSSAPPRETPTLSS